MSDLIIENDVNPNSKYRRLLDCIPTGGEEDAISMRDLSKLLEITERSVRKLVQDARISGNIIARSDNGYYIPTLWEDLKHYYNSSMCRIRSNSRSLNAVRDKLKEENEFEYYEDEFFSE